MFASVGFVNARVSDIVREAGLSQGSFYTYFASKQEIFRALTEDLRQQRIDAVERTDDDIPGDIYGNLERANLRFIKMYRKNASVITQFYDLAMVDDEYRDLRISGRVRNLDRVEESIRNLQSAGVVDPELDPAITAGALWAMLHNYVYWAISSGERVDDAVLLRTVTEIWTKALKIDDAR